LSCVQGFKTDVKIDRLGVCEAFQDEPNSNMVNNRLTDLTQLANANLQVLVAAPFQPISARQTRDFFFSALRLKGLPPSQDSSQNRIAQLSVTQYSGLSERKKSNR